MKEIFYQSSLPRSGSTLLQNIIAQNPDFYATPTSGLIALIWELKRAYANSKEFAALDEETTRKQLKGFMAEGVKGYFNAITDKKYIVDKGRPWSAYYKLLSSYQENPKIICMVRDLRCVFSSMEKLYRKHSTLAPDMIEDEARMACTTAKRVEIWSKSEPFGLAIDRLHQTILEGLDKHMLYVRFEVFIRDPQTQMNRIYDYLGVPRYNHNFDLIEQVTQEKDLVYPFHTIRNKLDIPEPDFPEVLGLDVSHSIRDGYDWFYDYFNYK